MTWSNNRYGIKGRNVIDRKTHREYPITAWETHSGRHGYYTRVQVKVPPRYSQGDTQTFIRVHPKGGVSRHAEPFRKLGQVRQRRRTSCGRSSLARKT